MFLRLRARFTYANVAATLAVVFAMSGGAYAANRYVISSTKQIKPSVLKQLAGKSGATGPAGSPGAGGPAGPAGPAGPTGPSGSNGETGAPGVKGEAGKEGKEGSPWTAGGTLPVGKSETGQWAIAQHASGEAEDFATGIAFNIALPKALDSTHVHYIGQNEGEGESEAKLPTGCSGTFAEPKAASGNLCVFTSQSVDLGSVELIKLPFAIQNAEEAGENGAGVTGAVLLAGSSPAKGVVIANGDWVVTAG
jgi:hypothetical protein